MARPHLRPFRRGALAALLALALLLPPAVRADEASDYRIGAVRSAWSLAAGFWRAQDLSGPAREREALRLAAEGQALARGIAAELRRAADAGDPAPLDAFARFLQARPAAERVAYAPILAELSASRNAKRLLSRAPAGEIVLLPEDPGYIPGYGTADPDGLYGRGATIESRVIGEIWHPRVHYLVVNERFRGTCAVELVSEIGERARELERLAPPVTETFNGAPVEVVPVSFRMNRYWRFATLRRFDVVRTEFELWRAPRRFLLRPRWERAGSTHLLDEAVTPAQILTGLK